MSLAQHEYMVLITDESLVEIGQPITNWTKIEVDREWNAPKNATVTVPADPQTLVTVFTPGRRGVLLRDGEYYIGGPIERPAEPMDWLAENDGSDGTGEFTFTFADDLLRIVSHVTLPDPTKLPEDAAQPEAWTATGNGETIMRDLVAANCVDPTGAVAYRKVPRLTLGAAAGVGTDISFRTRFEPMGDALRRAAIAAGGLGFTTRQTASGIEFVVFEPTDRTEDVRFSRGLGNLLGIHLEAAGPTCTDAIVGGGGEGADRLIVRQSDTAARDAWGLFEKFVDQRDTTDPTELAQAGLEALEEGAETSELTVAVATVPEQPIPSVGDLVTVELWPGEELTQVVRSDHLDIDADGEVLTLLVGTPFASVAPEWIKRVQAIARSVARLEAR